jgi:hypothetical protein
LRISAFVTDIQLFVAYRHHGSPNDVNNTFTNILDGKLEWQVHDDTLRPVFDHMLRTHCQPLPFETIVEPLSNALTAAAGDGMLTVGACMPLLMSQPCRHTPALLYDEMCVSAHLDDTQAPHSALICDTSTDAREQITHMDKHHFLSQFCRSAVIVWRTSVVDETCFTFNAQLGDAVARDKRSSWSSNDSGASGLCAGECDPTLNFVTLDDLTSVHMRMCDLFMIVLENGDALSAAAVRNIANALIYAGARCALVDQRCTQMYNTATLHAAVAAIGDGEHVDKALASNYDQLLHIGANSMCRAPPQLDQFARALRSLLRSPDECREAMRVLLHLIEKSIQRINSAQAATPLYTCESSVRVKVGPEVSMCARYTAPSAVGLGVRLANTARSDRFYMATAGQRARCGDES